MMKVLVIVCQYVVVVVVVCSECRVSVVGRFCCRRVEPEGYAR